MSPDHINAATSAPAAALDSGENGLRTPNVATDSGAVADSAAKPADSAPDAGGGAQRLSPSSKPGPSAASPATARYDSLNDSAYALSGLSATAMTNARASVASRDWGRSTEAAALDSQNIVTARATEGDGPTTYR